MREGRAPRFLDQGLPNTAAIDAFVNAIAEKVERKQAENAYQKIQATKDKPTLDGPVRHVTDVNMVTGEATPFIAPPPQAVHPMPLVARRIIFLLKQQGWKEQIVRVVFDMSKTPKEKDVELLKIANASVFEYGPLSEAIIL